LYCFAFAGLGLCIASLGPVLLNLSLQTETTLTRVGYCFAARSLGYLVFSMTGPLYDRMNGHLLIGAALIVAGLGSILIPLVTSVVLLGLVVSLQGAAMGQLDVGANVLLIYLWHAEVGPWMQTLHASFAVGAFLAPMMIRAVEAGHAHAILPDGSDGGEVDAGFGEAGAYKTAFFLFGAFNMVVGVLAFVMHSPKPRGQPGSARAAVSSPTVAASANPALTNGEPAAGDGAWQNAGLPASDAALHEAAPAPAATQAPHGPPHPRVLSQQLKFARLWVVFITAALLFLYVGCETGFGGFITPYAVLAPGETEASGQVLNGLYWMALMIGRILAIPVSIRVKPSIFLGVSMVGCVISSVIMLIGQSSAGVVWFFSFVFGLSMACIFPTAIALAESYFPVQGKDATVFVVGAATGEMLLPFIISTLFGDASEATGDEHAPTEAAARHAVGPSIMLWVVAVACIVNLGIYWALCKRGGKLRDALAAAAAAEQARDAAAAGAAGAESGLAGSGGGAGGKGWNTADLSTSSADKAPAAIFTGTSNSGSSKPVVGGYVSAAPAWDTTPADAAALGDSAAVPAYTTQAYSGLAFKHSGASAPACAASATHAAAPLYAPTAYPAEFEAAPVQSPHREVASTAGSGAEFAGVDAGSPAARAPLASGPAQAGYAGYTGWGGGVEAVADAEAHPLPSGEWAASSAAPASASSGPRGAGGQGEFLNQEW
jgi:FHS family Na+ dependent glucose MFS transporter 1